MTFKLPTKNEASKELVHCPYCTDGQIEYDVVRDRFECSDCHSEIAGIEYEKLVAKTDGAP